MGTSIAGAERVLRLRYALLGVVVAASTVLAGGRGDWPDFTRAGRALLGPVGLDVYVRHPEIQTGPPSLLVARLLGILPGDGFWPAAVLTAGAGLAAVRLVELAARRVAPAWTRDRLDPAVLLGGTLLMACWGPLAGYGHLDDAVVVLATAVALEALSRGRAVACGVAIGVATATKPWAVALLPLLAWAPAGDAEEAPRRRTLGVLWAVGIPAVVWAPFIAGAPDTLGSIRPDVLVAPDSVVRLATDAYLPPGWLRGAQLVVALALGSATAWRRRWMGVPAVVIATRLATDPATWGYYTAGLVFGALAFDLLGRRRVVPVTTIVAVTTVAVPALWLGDPGARAWLRLGGCLAVAALAALGPTEAQPEGPTPKAVREP